VPFRRDYAYRRTCRPSIKKIEAEGVKLDEPYRKNETTGVAITYITDPWGTRVELVQRALRP
jgi:hypothetical protein